MTDKQMLDDEQLNKILQLKKYSEGLLSIRSYYCDGIENAGGEITLPIGDDEWAFLNAQAFFDFLSHELNEAESQLMELGYSPTPLKQGGQE